MKRQWIDIALCRHLAPAQSALMREMSVGGGVRGMPSAGSGI